jgi:hypothetical protein
VIVVGTRDIPGASRTRATVIDSLLHGVDHGGVLAHAEIVIGTPDGHLPLAIRRITGGAREMAAVPLEIRKNAIPAFLMQAIQLAFEKCFEIHDSLQTSASVFGSETHKVKIMIPKRQPLRQKAHIFELFQAEPNEKVLP